MSETDVTSAEQPALSEGADAIVARGDHEMIVESVSQLRKQRQRDGDPFAEPEIIERRYRADDDRPKTLREASSDLSNAHRDESEEIQWAAEASGMKPEQVREYAKDPEWVQQRRPDWDAAAVSAYVRTGQMPPERIGVATTSGKAHAPIDDMSPVIGDRATTKPETGNLREVTRGLTNFREAAARLQQEELAALQAAYSEQQAAQQAQQPQQQVLPEPAPQPKPPPQQPNPVEAERQRLDLERRAVAELQKMSVAESAAYHQMNALQQQWQSIPEVRDRALANQTYARDPARWQQLQQAGREYQQRQAALAQEFQRHYEARVTREAQIAHYQTKQTEAAVANYNKQNDDRFQAWFKAEYPKENLADVSKYTRQALLRAGVDDRRISELWQSGALRGVETQIVLAKAGMHDLQQARQQQKSKDLASKRVPPVAPHSPGVARVRGSDDEAQISRLERELENASGNQAIKLSVRLTKAKRAAGRL
jgi:hypothetical protein